MRRLPIFFLVDVSESMVGENLYKLEESLGAIVKILRTDPHALETAFVSVIVFAGKARTVAPLTEIASFYPPELPVGGGTALGTALNHLMDEMTKTIVTTTPDRKGDWRPIIFLLTDGHPTDEVKKAEQRWNRDFRSRSNLVAVSIGGNADHTFLKRLTDDVVVFNDAAPDAFVRFVKWISMSIQSQTRTLSLGKDTAVSLAKAEPGLLAPVESARGMTPFGGIDDRYAVFVGKCEKSRLPYVVKYELHVGRIETADPVLANLLKTRRYIFTNALPVKNSYFELSDETASNQTVSSEDLIGQPNCPHCGARFGMAVCACGRIHCVGHEGAHTCPWCEKIGMYGFADAGDSFDIGRGRG